MISKAIVGGYDGGTPFYNYREPMLGIRDILVRIRNRILGSKPLTNGSGFDPDPAIFVIDLQEATKN
jgi:hypothetical protein